MGTPDFAVPTLDALLEAGHEVVAVYTQPPRPAGRGKALLPSPVQKRAEAAGLEVRSPVSLKGAEEQTAFAALDLEAAVVAAYGLILPEPILYAPEFGCINVHASLLPRWRGAAPIQRAILAGDTRTGVTIMQMEKGLDTGPMLAVLPTEIDRKTAGELTEELAALGARLMVQVLDRIHQVGRVPQNDARATYAPKIEKREAEARLRAECGVGRAPQVRAFNPFPGAFFELPGGADQDPESAGCSDTGLSGNRSRRQSDDRMRELTPFGPRSCSVPDAPRSKQRHSCAARRSGAISFSMATSRNGPA